ncbi:transporter substrate-binding domain-containing protein [Roseateles sp.]|uniref:substrate-binding periplasmic protein n=1 Tax=Roseateles sp. TaxID=1971397 RepID=UPI00286CD2B8|nr:transporter substrate-binding domain-containing protein [Roseateles sp.]
MKPTLAPYNSIRKTLWHLVCGFVLLLPASAFARELKFVGPDQPPYFWLAAGRPTGAFVQALDLACARLGHTCGYEVRPMARAWAEVKAGFFDGVVGLSFNKDRADFLFNPAPIFPANVVFLRIAGKNKALRSEAELNGVMIGVVRGSTSARKLRERQAHIEQLKISEEADVETLVKLLKLDRFGADGAIFGIGPSFVFEARSQGIALEPILEADINHLGVAFSRKALDDAEVDAFNVEFKAMAKSGAIRRISAQYGLLDTPLDSAR